MLTIRPFITMAPGWLRHPIFFVLVLIAHASLLSAAQVEDGIIAIVNSDLIMLSEMKRELARCGSGCRKSIAVTPSRVDSRRRNTWR